jgi:hypothetical protein
MDLMGLNTVLRLEMSQVEFLGKVLSRAFYNEPSIRYMMPDERVRRALLPWFFSSVVIPASQLYGEIYTTANIEGGALWISPGRAFTFGRIVRTGILAVPFKEAVQVMQKGPVLGKNRVKPEACRNNFETGHRNRS